MLTISILGYTMLSAQITGVVTDATTGEELIAVNISVKDKSTVGTVTDIDGSYAIYADANDILIFSYLGYTTLEIPVDGQASVNVKLSESSELLNEVVVIGYGAVKKEDLTGVVTKVGTKDFNKGSITTPERLLNGKVAGLQITSGGEPGAGSVIKLRGQGTISANGSPLIVIDGVPLSGDGASGNRNPLNFVNAADVESMTVLKDASAAAIYGARGASGVIIITTKSGKSGKMKIDYSGNVNTSIFNGDTKILSTSNFRNAILDKAPQEFEFLGDSDTDWVDEITQNAISTEHNINVSGGTDNLRYNFSGGYLNSKGVLKTSQHEKKSISGSISTELFDDKLKVTVKNRTSFMNDVFAPNVFGAALAMDPTKPVLDTESEYGGYFQWYDRPLATKNPVSSIELTDNKGKSFRTLNSINLEYQIPFIDGLSITSQASYDYLDGESRFLQNPLLREVSDRGGYFSIAESSSTTKQLETFGTFKRDFSSSKITITAGHSWLGTKNISDVIAGQDLALIDGEYLIQDSIEVLSPPAENRLISFFGRANYTYMDKYLLTASIRRDGSSKFGPSNTWGNFPAVALGWRVLQEDWASGLSDKLDNLKLRLSYGIVGNERIGNYQYNTFYSYGSLDARYQFGEEYYRTLRGLGVDPDIQWEQTASVNIGIDFGIWNNRISGSLDFYNKQTDKLLFVAATSAFTIPADRVLTNIGEMNNKGVEVVLNTVLVDKSDFDWSLGLNAAFNKNKIVKLDNSNDPSFEGYEDGGISGDIGQTIQILKVGESYGTFRTYEHILDDNGKPLVDDEDFNGDGIESELDFFRDINGDGIINELDLTTGKSSDPKLILGLTTNASYKNWDLSTTLRAHFGNYVYNNVASATGYTDRLTETQVTNNVHETAFIVNFKERRLKSDYYIENASFLKIDNLTLGYNLNQNKIFRNMRLYATVSNLFTFTGYSGLDPELPQVSNGIDNNQYPISRNFLLGVSASF